MPSTIDTVDDLRRHLQWAIELEHATIPPYMCALYSLDPDRNPPGSGRRYQDGDTPQSGPTGEVITIDADGIMPMRPNQLEQAFNGSPAQLGATVGTMYALKAQAMALLQIPHDDGETTAGPTFEYVPPEER